jgi:hypothetical protein
MRRSVRPCLAIASLCVAIAAAPAAAADPAPGKLLRAYPLEQRPTTVAKANETPPAPRAPDRAPAAAARPRSSALPQGAAIAAVALAMLVAAVVVVRRTRPAGATSLARRAPPEPIAPPPLRPAVRRRAVAPAASTETAVVVARRRPTERLPAETPRQRLCEIRWRCDGGTSFFEAVRADERGRELIAASAGFDWGGPEPPDRTPAAAEALDQLAGQLDRAGWRRTRGRGSDHGAPRWYARRYHLPPVGPRRRRPDEPLDPLEAGIA